MRWFIVVALASLTILAGAAASSGDLQDEVDEVLKESGESNPGVPAPGSATPDAAPSVPGTELFAAGLVFTSLIAAGTKHVTRDNVLEHETREEIHSFLWETGSAHLRRIADVLDLSTTNATWHLDKLVKAGLVGEVKENGYRMYYPKGGGRILREQCLMAAQLQSDNAQAVVEYVAENPGSHQREIARALDVNHGTARWHLSRLADAGILQDAREGRTTTYRLTENAKEVLSARPPQQLEGLGQVA